MKHSEKENIGKTALDNFDDEVSRRLEGGAEPELEERPIAPSSTIDLAQEPASSIVEAEPSAASAAETPASAVEPTPEPAIEVESAPAPAEEIPAEPEEVREEPTYGAPQPLFEDIIPPEFTRSEESRRAAEARADKVAAAAAAREAKEAEAERKRAEKEAEAERKRAEKEAAKEAKRQAKADKKKAKTAALIARVEAQAEQDAVREIERETGEHYELPTASAEPSPAPEAKPQEAEQPVASAETPAPAPEAAPVAVPVPEAEPMKSADKAPRKYSSYERKLRRKYKLDKDSLLSENDAVPGFIIAKGENVIRSYSCLSAGRGDGILCLTNKRLLINAGERSEIDIDKVSGIKFSRSTHFSFGKFLFWLIFFGLGVFMLLLPSFNSGMNIPGITGESWKDWFGILFYVCGGISVLISLPLFFTMVKKNFYFYVYAREEAPFLEYKSRSYAKREKKGKVYKYQVGKAGKESEKAARELGALIIEAKEGRYDD
ncbi:MAG: hypothetical protein J5765_01040 [Clostridia bacterium]|nr:hypothetical protein [Clostridia bacterium]